MVRIRSIRDLKTKECIMLYIIHQLNSMGFNTSGVIKFPVNKHTAGKVQYAIRGIDVNG